MIEIETITPLDAATRREVLELLHAVENFDGHPPLNELARLDLADGGAGYVGLLGRDPEHTHPAGYAHLSRLGTEQAQWALEIAVDPQHRGVGVELALARAAMTDVARAGGGMLHYWVFRPGEIHDALAHHLGFRHGRELLQMRRDLPAPSPHWPADVTVRAFEPGRDDEAWVAVNNRSFAGHPEQSGWDTATLARRAAEPWFDPAGFLLAEDGDGLAGFCWTKIHADGTGEIYVIGVDPTRQGTGLGRALVLGGLASMRDRGVTQAMLYVDAGNKSAVGLYEALGFTVDHVDRAYVATVDQAPNIR